MEFLLVLVLGFFLVRFVLGLAGLFVPILVVFGLLYLIVVLFG